MDAEDFELAVTVTILLRRVRKRRFERKPRKQRVRTKFKAREEKGAKRENFYHANIGIFSISAKFHLLLNCIYLFSTVTEKCKIFWKAKILTKLQK